MRLMTGITMMSMIFATVVSGFRHRPRNLYCVRKTSRMMSTNIPRTELRFGQSLNANDLEAVVNAFAFDIYIKNLSSHLERTDKPAFEWFERFLFEIPAEDDDHFELHVMNKLMTAHTFLLEHEITSPENTDLSLSFSHCVEPCLLATLLLDGKKAVLKGKFARPPLMPVFAHCTSAKII